MTTESTPIPVAAVGVRPGEYEGILEEVPQDDRFKIVAFSDEGLEPRKLPSYPFTWYSDYNKLLHQEEIELVLVDGPIDLRCDFAVRAANAGKQVVVARPFADTTAEAYRMAKTARRNKTLITGDMPERSDLLYRKVRQAVKDGVPGGIFAIEHRLYSPTELADLPEEGLLMEYGVDLLDQVLVLLDSEVKDVRCFTRDVREDVDYHFRIAIALRSGGWASVEMLIGLPCPVPEWTILGANGCLISDGDSLVHYGSDGQTELEAACPEPQFWQNIHDAVRNGAEPDINVREIVRAYRVHEVAVDTIEDREPRPV